MTNRSAGAGRDGSRLRELVAEMRLEAENALDAAKMHGRGTQEHDAAMEMAVACVRHANKLDAILAVPDPLASDTGQARYENVWIVTEYEGGGIRGVFVSQGDAEAEIAAICAEHRDLTRRDFVVQIDRVRRRAAAPLASSSAPQGETGRSFVPVENGWEK